MCRRRTIKSQPFLRFFEVSSDHIGKLFWIYGPVILKRVQVVNRDEPRSHIPPMGTGFVMRLANVIRWLIVGSEKLMVRVRIPESDRLVGEVTQRLVILDGPDDFFADVWGHQLRAPIAMIGSQKRTIGNVVQQARNDNFLFLPSIQRSLRTLQ